MLSVGEVQSVQRVDEGSVCVTYNSAEEASAAAAQLQQTIIAGNSRYIDVLLMDPEAFLAEHNIDEEKAQQFFAMSSEQQQAVMARGTLSTARDPTAVLVQRMRQVQGSATGKGFTSKPAQASFPTIQHRFASASMPEVKSNIKRAPNNLGSKHNVLVRGFDFGTSEEQIGAHMSSVGAIQGIQWVDELSACVTYASTEEATAAVAQLQQIYRWEQSIH